jgi:hypothetical protein
MYLETVTMEKYCVGCGEQIPPKRVEILPHTKTCVKCSETGRKRGLSVQVGEGDHSYTDVVILEEKQFINYIVTENKMRKKYAGQSKAEFFSTDDDDYISPDASENVNQIQD